MENFDGFGLDGSLIEVLKLKGIVSPTSVQVQVIPKIINGDDILITWPTGSGKTLSFLLPIIKNIMDKKQEKALILSPTRELAIQITNEGKALAESAGLRLLCIYGGVDVEKELKRFKKDFDILVATPGRLLDHMRRESLDLSKINTVVVDEVDQMLLMGFNKDVDEITDQLAKNFQFLGFSATNSPQVKKIAYRYSQKLDFVEEKEVTSNRYIKQEVVMCSDRQKKPLLFEILEADRPYMGIIFCRTKRRVDELYESMIEKKFNARCIHSDIPQPKRQRIMKEFRSGDIQYLIATDVASRGLDISGVDAIYNYDVPESSEDYIHRIGRSGRVKDDGYALTFVVPRHEILLDKILETVGEIPVRNMDR